MGFSQEKAHAVQVVEQLKKEGRKVASHSYGHLNVREISNRILELDSARSKSEVDPLIGKTNILIFPFGSSILPGDK